MKKVAPQAPPSIPKKQKQAPIEENDVGFDTLHLIKS